MTCDAAGAQCRPRSAPRPRGPCRSPIFSSLAPSERLIQASRRSCGAGARVGKAVLSWRAPSCGVAAAALRAGSAPAAASLRPPWSCTAPAPAFTEAALEPGEVGAGALEQLLATRRASSRASRGRRSSPGTGRARRRSSTRGSFASCTWKRSSCRSILRSVIGPLSETTTMLYGERASRGPSPAGSPRSPGAPWSRWAGTSGQGAGFDAERGDCERDERQRGRRA